VYSAFAVMAKPSVPTAVRMALLPHYQMAAGNPVSNVMCASVKRVVGRKVERTGLESAVAVPASVVVSPSFPLLPVRDHRMKTPALAWKDFARSDLRR
jgi:hypothetical protein